MISDTLPRYFVHTLESGPCPWGSEPPPLNLKLICTYVNKVKLMAFGGGGSSIGTTIEKSFRAWPWE